MANNQELNGVETEVGDEQSMFKVDKDEAIDLGVMDDDTTTALDDATTVGGIPSLMGDEKEVKEVDPRLATLEPKGDLVDVAVSTWEDSRPSMRHLMKFVQLFKRKANVEDDVNTRKTLWCTENFLNGEL